MTNEKASARVFDAMGDATRRSIVDRLGNGPLPVGRLADGLPVSRPAVSQHLKVLKEAGIVTEQAEGTRRIYRLDPRGLGVLRDWLDQHWAQALNAFVQFTEDQGEEG